MSPQDMARVSRCNPNCPPCQARARRARLIRTVLVVVSFTLTIISIPVGGIPGVLLAAGTVFGAVAVVLTRRAMKAGKR